MAGFKAHITTSSLIGIGYGVGAHFGFGMPISSCVLAGGLCGVAGMLPDLDSDSGRPLRESMAFAAAVVPMLMLRRFEALGMNAEQIVLAGAGLYLLIRFGFSELLQRFTVHRGMFHSIPAAFIAGLFIFLLSPEPEMRLRVFKSLAVVVGYMSHLMLDEIHSLNLGKGRIKKSLGSAMKVFGHGWLPNLAVYSSLFLLAFMAIKEPAWMSDFRDTHIAVGDKPAVEGEMPAQDSLVPIVREGVGDEKNASEENGPLGSLRAGLQNLFR
jgi:LexA-binding, inner membrane-associated putative hydrolase